MTKWLNSVALNGKDEFERHLEVNLSKAILLGKVLAPPHTWLFSGLPLPRMIFLLLTPNILTL